MSGTITTELKSIIYGKELGSGVSRTVYEYLPDKSCVIKVEETAGWFQNIREWEMWKDSQMIKEITKWLAPVIDISPCGLLLIQKRVLPLRDKEVPTHLPAFLSDCKRDNYGIYEGRVVCCDYGTALMSLSTRMRKVDFS